ncbi:FecCD family ABC transporter permease [Paenibacillus xerothermodurans]|uniref:Iron ABC transporter permease n=1 Tax=Paenibacillus xerothermodurans TaxID=1977292 RepID=A0A2W1NX40_PAEXE|nr:iron ABC transporter permease [Paenibacillus xerothermodurans]PZE22286.1 iron ABC transporter permease [Paenibacillus xerothermodurans]
MNLPPYSAAAARTKKRALVVYLVLGTLIMLFFLISINTGQVRLSPAALWQTLWGNGTAREELILFEFRLPRIVVALLIGTGFAVSGCILQGLTRNALAEPGILGINAGAGLAVILFISYFPDNQSASVYALPFIAFLGAGLTAALIYILSVKRDGELSPSRLLVTGVAVAAAIASLILVLTIRLDPAQYQFVSIWLAGSIRGSSWQFVIALLPWLALLIPLVLLKSQVLNILALGDLTASGLGANVPRQRMALLAIAVALAGSCVAVGGGIAFVGLIAPHLARRLVGPQHQYALPVSALLGALLLIVADAVSRMIFTSGEIPTGIVVALIGAPYFLMLLAKGKR